MSPPTSTSVESIFDPKDDIELAELHHINLEKYKISSYWSKLKSNGKFTSSVFCTERKLGDSISLDEIKTVLSEIVTSSDIPTIIIPKIKDKNQKALVFWVADEHVGASVTDGLYANEWNKSEYFNRKSKILEVADEQFKIHGAFDKIILANLGDSLDGFNGQTTRGGHKLPQNMSNKEAIKTYVEVNRIIIDELVSNNYTDKHVLYNVENSNHGGLGWDAAANYALEMYLKTKYPSIKMHGFDKLIESFSYGVNDFHLTHGKDDTYMKRNFPLHLETKIESFIKEYLDENDFKDKTRPQHVVKGDLHQFATQQGKFFNYTNIPSLFGGSAWVSLNFGKSKAGFCYSIVPKNSDTFGYTPYWF